MNVSMKYATYLYNLYYRCLLGMILFYMVLYLLNADLFKAHPFYVFPLFVAPYLLYYGICFAFVHLLLRAPKRQWAWIGLGGLLILGSFWIVKSYYYILLPAIKVVFYSAWKDDHYWILLKKIFQGLFFILLLIAVDYYCFNWLIMKIQTKRLERILRDRADSSLLSGHFLRRLYQLTARGKKQVDVEVLDFFQSISNKLVAQHVRVALEEEWSFVKRMIALCPDRQFVIIGEEQVLQQIWNRSVPSLSLMTWIENAVTYSMDGSADPIVLSWNTEPDRTVLEIRNAISTASIAKGTGNGLRLVNRLYESCQNDRVHLDYTVDDHSFFSVKLSFFK